MFAIHEIDYLFLRHDLQDELDPCSYGQEDLQTRNIFSHISSCPHFLANFATLHPVNPVDPVLGNPKKLTR
jgi:hypothetical protein